MPNINLIYYLIAGGIFGALALKTGIPAAPLAGALTFAVCRDKGDMIPKVKKINFFLNACT